MKKNKKTKIKRDKKFRLSFKLKLILICLVPLLISSSCVIFISSTTLADKINIQAEESLRVIVNSFSSTFDTLLPGDYATGLGGTLSKGNVLLASKSAIVSDTKKSTGYDCSIIFKGKRVLSSLKDDKNISLLGSEMDKETYEKAIASEKLFLSDVSLNKRLSSNYYAYYMPIFDSKGEVVGLIGAAKPYEGVQETIRSEVFKLVLICGVVIVVALFIVILTVTLMGKAMKKTTGFLSDIADGDLTVVPFQKLLRRKDEFGDIYRRSAEIEDRFKTILEGISDSARTLSTSAETLLTLANDTRTSTANAANAIQQLSESASLQSEHTSSVNTNIENIGVQINSITDVVKLLNTDAKEMTREGHESKNIIDGLSSISDETASSISNISKQIATTNEAISQIRSAADVIQNIAEETDLLSLNASIEAARAGEQGRGFAVVAQQICKLADQSNQAAKEIETVVNSVISESEKSVEFMEVVLKNLGRQQEQLAITKEKFDHVTAGIEKSEKNYNDIYDKTSKLTDSSVAISNISKQLADISERNSDYTDDSLSLTEDVSSSVDKLDDASKELIVLSGNLLNALRSFKTE